MVRVTKQYAFINSGLGSVDPVNRNLMYLSWFISPQYIGGLIMSGNIDDVLQMTAGGGFLYELHKGGNIYRHRYDGSEVNIIVDQNHENISIAANDHALYLLHRGNGQIWEFIHSGRGGRRIDSNPKTVRLSVGQGRYDVCILHSDGAVYRWSERGFERIDKDPKNSDIWASSNSCFILHRGEGQVWKWTSRGVNRIEANSQNIQFAANKNGNALYLLHNDGTVWESTGGGFKVIDRNKENIGIGITPYGDVGLLHNDGAIYKYKPGPRWERATNVKPYRPKNLTKGDYKRYLEYNLLLYACFQAVFSGRYIPVAACLAAAFLYFDNYGFAMGIENGQPGNDKRGRHDTRDNDKPGDVRDDHDKREEEKADKEKADKEKEDKEKEDKEKEDKETPGGGNVA